MIDYVPTPATIALRDHLIDAGRREVCPAPFCGASFTWRRPWFARVRLDGRRRSLAEYLASPPVERGRYATVAVCDAPACRTWLTLAIEQIQDSEGWRQHQRRAQLWNHAPDKFERFAALVVFHPQWLGRELLDSLRGCWGIERDELVADAWFGLDGRGRDADRLTAQQRQGWCYCAACGPD